MVLNSNGSLEITDNDQGASHCSKPDALASVSGQISQGNQQGTRAVNFTNPVFSSQTDLPIGGNRYQMVFTLADQGLDQSIIAARTGLEQEAIRMLLTFGGPSHISH
jgi:hypothetical protein